MNYEVRISVTFGISLDVSASSQDEAEEIANRLEHDLNIANWALAVPAHDDYVQSEVDNQTVVLQEISEV